MKELNLFIRPDMLERVKLILVDQFDCGGMTVLNVLGCGNQKGFVDEYVGIRTSVNLLPKLKVEVFVKDEDVDSIIEAIGNSIRTGRYGDGKIFVKPVDDAVRIRTNERGETAV